MLFPFYIYCMFVYSRNLLHIYIAVIYSIFGKGVFIIFFIFYHILISEIKQSWNSNFAQYAFSLFYIEIEYIDKFCFINFITVSRTALFIDWTNLQKLFQMIVLSYMIKRIDPWSFYSSKKSTVSSKETDILLKNYFKQCHFITFILFTNEINDVINKIHCKLKTYV
jgi:hypothetical protein